MRKLTLTRSLWLVALALASCTDDNPDLRLAVADARAPLDEGLPDAGADGAGQDATVLDATGLDAAGLDATGRDGGVQDEGVDFGDAWTDGALDAAPDGGAVDLDGDGFPSGQDCDDANPQVFPGAEERCDGLDNDCNGAMDDGLGLGEPCAVGLGRCQQLGEFVCGLGEQIVCSASAAAPSPELCNAVDDDCDGEVDEGLEAQDCQVGVGLCAREGRLLCSDGVMICAGEAGEPSQERCNGVDDDCDGLTDEGFGGGGECSVGVGQCVGLGRLRCNAQGELACDAVEGRPEAERCNGLDDDCDGRVDEDFALGVRCTVGLGLCVATGRTYCLNDEVACDAVPANARPEVCNLIDDDCDGQIDEGLVNACGLCGPVPAEICNRIDDDCDGQVDEGVTNACGGCGALPSELCNAVDDDCDGAIDEGYPVGQACSVGAGQCARSGRFVCVANGSALCNATAGLPSAEVCNGLDDDCDGQTDEGVANACGGCGPVPAEVCNGLDDDCDGQADEGLAAVCVARVGLSAVGFQDGRLGTVLVHTGDLNGDGKPDALAGAPGGPTPSIWLISGADGRRIWHVQGQGALGASVAAGDFDGDGAVDVAGGAPELVSPTGGVGAIYFHSAAGARLSSLVASQQDGFAATLSAGYFGFVDAVATSEPTRDGRFVDAGRVLVYRMGQSGEVGEELLAVGGSARNERLGERVFVVPDLDYDGVAELIVTSRNNGDRTTLLLSGATGESFGRISPYESSNLTFGASFAYLVQGNAPVFAFGAPGAVNGAGAIYFAGADGRLTMRYTASLPNAGQGAALAAIARDRGGLFAVGATAAARVDLYDVSTGAVTLVRPADAGASFGTSVAASGALANGTYRLFVGEPTANRVHVFSVR